MFSVSATSAEPLLAPAMLSRSLESSLDRVRWQRVLGKIARSTASECCVLGLSDLDLPLPTLIPSVRVGGNRSMVESMRSRLAALRVVPEGTVAVANGEQDARSKRDKAHEPMSVVGLRLLNVDQHSLVFAASRLGRRGRYQVTETRFFERLAPRLCRLGTMLDASFLEVTKATALAATFDALATAVIITSRDGRVVCANSTAHSILSCGRGLCVRSGKLSSHDKLSAVSLKDVIGQLSSRSRKHNRISIVLRANGAPELLVTVIALTNGDKDQVLDTGAVAVFVRDPDLGQLIPAEGFAKLYSLTACELSLLFSMMPGRSVKDAAAALGISEATARTHLHHIFMKTGTTKQVELMRLFLSYALPVLAEPDARLQQGAAQSRGCVQPLSPA